MEEFMWQDIENIVVEEFKEKHAESLAQMWNESDVDWPGGFTGGIKLTGEKLLEAYQQAQTACRYVLYDKKKMRVAGVLEFLKIPGNKEAVYVGINIHPAYRGAALILLGNLWIKSVDKLVELGYRYAEMETWPTNVRVIVVCKQAGFYWVPDTAVKMENYFPLLMATPIILKFFTKYDIVECQYEVAALRNTDMVEDKIMWQGIEVFPYEWKKKKEFIKALIDVRGKGITSIENQDFTISCYPANQGIAYTGGEIDVFWEIVNKKDEDLNISLIFTPDPELQLMKKSKYIARDEVPLFEKMKEGYEIRRPHAYLIKGGQSLKIKEKFKISPDAKPRLKPRAHRIHSKIFVNQEIIELDTGIKIKPILEVEFNPPNFSLKPNQLKSLYINLKNNYPHNLEGKIKVKSPSPDLKIEEYKKEIRLKPEEHQGIKLNLTSPKTGSYTLSLSIDLFLLFPEGNSQYLSTVQKDFNFHVLHPNQTLGSIREEELVLENEHLILKQNLKNGLMVLEDKFSSTQYLQQTFDELGPPFKMLGEDPSFLEEKEFTVEMKNTGSEIKAVITTESIDIPKVFIKKEITFNSSPLIKIRYILQNKTNQRLNTQLKVRTKSMRSDSILTVPLSSGIISERVIGKEYPTPGKDLPDLPEDYSEYWSSWENSPLVGGLIWKGAIKIEYGMYKMPDLTFNIPEIAPQDCFSLEPFYIYAGFGNWETVRYYYQKILGETDYEFQKLTTLKLVDIKTKPELITIMNEPKMVKLKIVNNRQKFLSGKLSLSAESPALQINPLEFKILELNLKNRWEEKIEINSSEVIPNIYKIRANLETEATTYSFSLPVVVIGNKKLSLKIEEKEEEKKKIIEIDNQYFSFKVCPEFNGSIYELKVQNVSHLISAFPESVNFNWFSPWFGGIYPINMKDLSFPAKLATESYTYQTTKRLDNNGQEWEGIKLISSLTLPEIKGVKQEVEYLTLPGSNLLGLRVQLKNSGESYLRFFSGIGIFLNVGGNENTHLHYLKDNWRIRKRTMYDAWTGCEDIAFVQNYETKDIIGVVACGYNTRIIVADLGIMGPHLFLGSQITLKPQEIKEWEGYIFHHKDEEVAKNYQILSLHKLFTASLEG